MAALGLSSSSARMTHQDAVIILSSSPEFPSICELLPKPTKKPTLRSGSNAAPVPDGACTTFTTASALRKADDDATLTHGRLERTIEAPSKPAVDCANTGSERASGKGKAAGPRTGRGKAQQLQPKDGTDASLMDNPPAEAPVKKPARKPRQTKDGAQTTLPKGKVTKPAAKGPQTKKKGETVSRHFAPQPPAPPRELPADPIDDEPVILEQALRRRMDWTPPQETAPAPGVADSSATKEAPSSEKHVPNDVFKTLQDTYGRSMEAEVNGNPAVPSTTDVLGKRKLIEMVPGVGNKQKTPEASPTKPKAVKKKPRTITELATAAYRLPESEDVSSGDPKQDSLLGYLEARNEEMQSVCNAAAAKGKGPRRPVKPRPKQTKKEPAPKKLLLSPTSALRQVAKQDFVFGTASQLATEDDPDLLRALHEAMKASNQADDDPFASPDLRNSSLALRKRPGMGLWAAGARYGDGDVLGVDVLDLTRSSPTVRAQLAQENSCADDKLKTQGTSSNQACIEIEMSDDSLEFSTTPPISHPKPPPQPAISRISQAIHLDESCPSDHDGPQTPIDEVDFEPPPSNQEQHQLLLSQSNSPRREQPTLPPRPNFELYTDARLAKEVASYGFKVVKKRAAMVALLNQCWESQHKASLGSRTAHATMATTASSQAVSPSRPRGRPKKDAAPPAPAVVEPPTSGVPGRNSCVLASVPGSAPLAQKRPRGRPRKDSVASGSDVTGAPAPARRGRKKSASASDMESDPPAEKGPEGGSGKVPATALANRSPARASRSPKRVSAVSKPAASAPATPRRRKAAAKSASTIEIPDSDIDDPFVSTPASSPSIEDDVFSSPPAMDLSVTEDTESSLMASPTSQQVSLFRYITQAVVSAPPTKDPANPSWHEKMLMYDPIVLEDLTAWLNAGQLDRVGYDGEVAPGDVKKWCESKSVCCLWRVNLRGKERKRF